MLTQSQSDVACEIRANSFGASLLSRSGPLSPVVLGLYHFMTAPSSLALTSRKPKGKFPARPSNKSRFLLWPCKIATSLFDPNFIFLPFHGPAVTSAVNSQLSDCEKTIVPLAHKQQILRSHGEQILEMYSTILCSKFSTFLTH